ncbi:hypothetical protein MMC28_005298 [Mycoblastus sanguinarius]|nr:hypothetical protein [Mycoblastus sanguinarius]
MLSSLFFLPLLLTTASAASSLPPNSISPDLPTNLTYPQFPPAALNLSNARRYLVPGTSLALDFWHQNPDIDDKDVLMALVEGLSQIFGLAPTEPIPGLSTFKYKRNAFVHIQDLNPTPGRAHTYRDMADTIRGVGEYMTSTNLFKTTEFQVWSIGSDGTQLKIGSGGVGGPI